MRTKQELITRLITAHQLDPLAEDITFNHECYTLHASEYMHSPYTHSDMLGPTFVISLHRMGFRTDHQIHVGGRADTNHSGEVDLHLQSQGFAISDSKQRISTVNGSGSTHQYLGNQKALYYALTHKDGRCTLLYRESRPAVFLSRYYVIT